MAQLRILRSSGKEKVVPLESAVVYSGGRDPKSQIPLDPEAGISRKHFTIEWTDGYWLLKNHSRFGLLKVDGNSVPEFSLRDGTTFEVGSYKFIFEDDQQAAGPSDEVEKTRVGFIQLIPYVKVLDPSGEIHAVFRLEGETWQAGRDKKCSLFIDQSKFSRKQFEIQKQGNQYFARDLGSSNGTQLNGNALGENDWTPLKSSDLLSVADWSLIFELRDAGYDDKLNAVDPNLQNLPAMHADQSVVHQSPFPTGAPTSSAGRSKNSSDLQSLLKNKKVLTYGALGVVVLIFAFSFSDDPKPDPKDIKTPTNASPFDRLTPEQKAYVQQSYLTGQQLLMQGKYELARQEMIKIRQLVPNYEDSKQIEEMADTAIKTLKEKEIIEAKEKERMEADRKVVSQAQKCRAQIQINTTQSDLENCLGSVLSLAPDHPAIQSLRDEVEKQAADKNMREAVRLEREEKLRKLQSLMSLAQRKEKEQEYKEALRVYAQVAQSPISEGGGIKGQATKKIKEIKDQMQVRKEELSREAEAAIKKNDVRKAIVSLRKLIKDYPDEEEAKSKLDRLANDHKKLMQALYQEAVLEESIGEVTQAIAKWRKVIDQSYPEEEYYQKSRMKLQKYGG